MSLKQLFNFMVPSDHRFFPLFRDAANNLVETSELLIKLIREDDLEGRKVYVAAIKENESRGDTITAELLEELSGTYITPFDREDINELNNEIDNVVDLINTTAKKINLSKLNESQQDFIQIADLIHDASKEIQLVLRSVKNASDYKKFKGSCLKIRSFEKEVDNIYQEYMINLFDNEKDPVLLIKKRDILVSLEKTIDHCDQVSKIFSAIIIKNE